MLKKLALIVGIVFIVIGIAGFIPGITVTSDGVKKLLGLFQIDTVHNIVHILSGIVFLLAASRGRTSRVAFQVFGVVYTLVTIIGFIVGSGNTVLGLFHVNTADNYLHLVLTVVFLYLGFAAPAREDTLAPTPAA